MKAIARRTIEEQVNSGSCQVLHARGDLTPSLGCLHSSFFGAVQGLLPAAVLDEYNENQLFVEEPSYYLGEPLQRLPWIMKEVNLRAGEHAMYAQPARMMQCGLQQLQSLLQKHCVPISGDDLVQQGLY